MHRHLFAGFAAALTSMLLVTALAAQPEPSAEPEPAARQVEDAAELEKQSQQAYDSENWLRFYIANIKLHKQRPYEPRYLSNIVRACGRLDRKSTAYHYMLIMQQQGLEHDFNAFEDTVSIRDTEAYRYINDLLVRAGDPAGSAEVFTQLSSPARDIQTVAWDAGRDRLLAGTAARGAVLALGSDGSTEVLLEADRDNGLWSVNGLAVDPVRNRLWISSAATPAFSEFVPEDENKGALFEFDLQTLALLNRYDLPEDGLAHELGSLALTTDGQVYVIDRAAPIIYRKRASGQSLEAFVSSTDLEGFRDIAVTPDNSRIFATDPFKGVFVVDPVAEQTVLLSGPENISLGRIEGIEYSDGKLYVMQSGISPDRLVRIELDQTGSVVSAITPVAVALPEFDQPGALTLDGRNLFFVANRNAESAAKALIMQTTVDAGMDHVPAELQKARDEFLPPPQ